MEIKLLLTKGGNILSIENWLNRNEIIFKKIKSIKYLNESDTLILPGILNSISLLKKITKDEKKYGSLKNFKLKKIVGICAGFQILCRNIHEDGITMSGLNFIPAYTKKISQTSNTGWINEKKFKIFNEKKLRNFEKYKFYFNHYYGVFPYKNTKSFSLIQNNSYSACYFSKKIIGLQFHPEKSGVNGDNLAKIIFN